MSSRRVHRHHSCRLWVVADELRYQNLAARGKKEKAIPLGLIETVLLGPASEVFRRNGVRAESSDGAACFSLVCGGRTLDLQAPPASPPAAARAHTMLARGGLKPASPPHRCRLRHRREQRVRSHGERGVPLRHRGSLRPERCVG